jgi:mono/diheme cytochrome c family protein
MNQQITRWCISVSLCLAVTAALGGIAARAQSTFTASQATAGKAVYAQSCAQCHGATMQGGAGPALKSAALTKKYAKSSDLYSFISKQMPLGAPGSLSATQYQAVTAYVLQQNGRLGK